MHRYLVTLAYDLFTDYMNPCRDVCCVQAPSRMAAWNIVRREFGPRPAFILIELA